MTLADQLDYRGQTLVDSDADRLIALHDAIRVLPSFAPSQLTDALFGELTRFALERTGDDREPWLDSDEIRAILPDLRRMSAAAEYQRECHWSRKIIDAENSVELLEQAPFFENYIKLVRFEVQGIIGAGHDLPTCALMVGSGPMPVTSVLLERDFGIEVHGVDIDQTACELGRAMRDAVGVGAGVVHHCAALDYEGFGDYDLVVLGANVGLDRAERIQTIRHLARHMSPGSLLLVRTAHGMRTILFPQINATDLDGFATQLLIRPLDNVVNSVIVASRQ